MTITHLGGLILSLMWALGAYANYEEQQQQMERLMVLDQAHLRREAQLAPYLPDYSALLERGLFTPATISDWKNWADEWSMLAVQAHPSLSIQMRFPTDPSHGRPIDAHQGTGTLEILAHEEQPVMAAVHMFSTTSPALIEWESCDWEVASHTVQLSGTKPLQLSCQFTWTRWPDPVSTPEAQHGLPEPLIVSQPAQKNTHHRLFALPKLPAPPSKNAGPRLPTEEKSGEHATPGEFSQGWIKRSDGMVLRWPAP